MPLGTRIFLGTAAVVVAVLGASLLVTKHRADEAADAASSRAVRSTAASIGDALASRSETLRRLTEALVQVPAYVSRIGESLRTGDRANLLDQADELRTQTGSDWILITDGSGVLQAWTAERGAFDQDFSRGALIGRALEGQATEGLWLEPGAQGDDIYQAVGVPGRAQGPARRSASWWRRRSWTARSRSGFGGTPTATCSSFRSTRSASPRSRYPPCRARRSRPPSGPRR